MFLDKIEKGSKLYKFVSAGSVLVIIFGLSRIAEGDFKFGSVMTIAGLLGNTDLKAREGGVADKALSVSTDLFVGSLYFAAAEYLQGNTEVASAFFATTALSALSGVAAFNIHKKLKYPFSDRVINYGLRVSNIEINTELSDEKSEAYTIRFFRVRDWEKDDLKLSERTENLVWALNNHLKEYGSFEIVGNGRITAKVQKNCLLSQEVERIIKQINSEAEKKPGVSLA